MTLYGRISICVSVYFIAIVHHKLDCGCVFDHVHLPISKKWKIADVQRTDRFGSFGLKLVRTKFNGNLSVNRCLHDY